MKTFYFIDTESGYYLHQYDEFGVITTTDIRQAYSVKDLERAKEIVSFIKQHVEIQYLILMSCDESCGPNDYHKEGRCGQNGCVDFYKNNGLKNPHKRITR